MKIAIYTLNDYFNYGNRLQVFALSEFVKSLGHEVHILIYKSRSKYDIKFLYEKYIFERRLFDVFISPLKIALKLIKFITNSAKTENETVRSKQLREFSKIYLNERKVLEEDLFDLVNEYDAFIVGSDQVWNINLLNELAFLDFADKGVKVGYALSVGNLKISKRYKLFLINKVKNFKNTSFRESSTIRQLNQLSIENEIKYVVDPVLLFKKPYWEQFSNKSTNCLKNNLVIYYLGNLSEIIISDIRKIGDYNLVVINDETSSYYGYDIKSFVGLFRSAKYIVTNSFHGTVLSLIFEKNFISLDNGSSSTRMTDLLSYVGLNDRFDNLANIDKIVDWNSVEMRLNKLRIRSYDFLKDSLVNPFNG